MRYINLSGVVKTFYGVEFKPGDVRDVDGQINDPDMFTAFGVPVTQDSDPDAGADIPVTTEPEPAPKPRRKSIKEGE